MNIIVSFHRTLNGCMFFFPFDVVTSEIDVEVTTDDIYLSLVLFCFIEMFLKRF